MKEHTKDRLRIMLYERDKEIEQLRADKAAISQTAADYLHEIDALRALVVDSGAEIEQLRRLAGADTVET